jgi:hypothetical protein
VYLVSDQDHPIQDLVSPPGWNWVSVSISGNCIFARARVRESGATAVSVRSGDSHLLTIIQFKLYEVDTMHKDSFKIDETDPSPHLIYDDGVISQTGHLLYQEQSQALLDHIKYDFSQT